jgi:hypothetical protein
LRAAIESREQGVVKVRLGRAGEGARELFPWTAVPGAQKNFDPEHPLAGDAKGRNRLALVLYSMQPVSCPSSLALCISHPLPIPRGPLCLRACVNVCECRGGKRSKVSPRGALNLPAAWFLQTKRFGPLPFCLRRLRTRTPKTREPR